MFSASSMRILRPVGGLLIMRFMVSFLLSLDLDLLLDFDFIDLLLSPM